MGAKLRNLSRVAGERVREMDHFVESVSTPVVRLRLAAGGSDSDSGAGEGELGVRRALEAAVRRAQLQASRALRVRASW